MLLLFNIQTILATENADIRFPFDRYKDEDWDIEHVRSKASKSVTVNHRHAWCADMLEYLTGVNGTYSDNGDRDGKKFSELQIQAISEMSHDENKKLAIKILELFSTDVISDDIFEKVYNEVSVLFGENIDPENIDSISNLALLDSATNRSYKNAMFPIKRKKIIENDMNGIFVPICTKNLFLKLYSMRMADLLYWTADDARNYLNAIKKTLHEYLT
ncbi:hypothetical protein HF329_33290 [Chitinophaga oryzae]|uniref:DUF1524 domain-containing protein n=1 Tax=Chitinophaga oryzae TaxID=2725414 RepID=A0AAE7DBC2_9BACT|nr:hypothetical protein [Chitinophaga oryzae]QJB35925.1 hypothetical protein HF329_33290 [Chitinophaga oryzae]